MNAKPHTVLCLYALTAALVTTLARMPAADPPPVAASATGAGLPAQDIPVVLVDGQPISLRQLEDTLLKKEGVDHLQEWFTKQLDNMDWNRFGDDTPILTVAGATITRRDIAIALLKEGAGKAREDLIEIALVEHALVKEGIDLGKDRLDAEWDRLDKRFQDDLERKGKPRISYEQYLLQIQKQSREQFMAQPGFRMLAGVHALAERRAAAEWGDDGLRTWFDQHRAIWDKPEAVNLQTLFIRYDSSPGPDGKPVVDEAERKRVLDVARLLHRAVADGSQKLEDLWRLYGRAWDSDSLGGNHGWLGQDGKRPGAARRLPPEVMDAAWSATGLPRLLDPVVHSEGVELVRVLAHREAAPARFEDVRDRVLRNRLDAELDQRTQALLTELRRNAEVKYESLPSAIRKREGATIQVPGPLPAKSGKDAAPQPSP